ncbi:hypothetical protein ACPTIT_31725, partial [Pseudomonas aeruginosa]|uniref:hypothetical protein n=1 Tax=Pseudomonas aeruginosa TaxID=287 RepID=UPI003CC50176
CAGTDPHEFQHVPPGYVFHCDSGRGGDLNVFLVTWFNEVISTLLMWRSNGQLVHHDNAKNPLNLCLVG